MPIKIEVHGLEEAQREIARIAANLRPALNAALEEGIAIIEVDAKALAPVDTGALRASIVSGVKGTDTVVQGVVSSNLVYAPVQEKRVGFLRKALEQNAQKVVSLVESVIDRLIRG